jgi:hypothetical protein
MSLVPECLDIFYSYSAFKCSSNISWCLVNINIPAIKTEAPQMDPKTKMAIFSKMAVIILIIFWKFMETITIIKT